VCQTSDVKQTEGKTVVENAADQRTQINLNDAAGQIALLVGAIVILDIFLSVFAFGFLNNETKKKYHRQGLRYPFQTYQSAQSAGPKIRNPFRRRPSALAITLRKKLRQALTPRRPLYAKNYGKRSVEVDFDREDVFRPSLDYELNDDHVLQSIDILDTTFGVMNVDSEICRQRTICEMERVASRYPIVSFFVKTVGPFVKGLENYEDAAHQGRNGEDCALYYGECHYSLNKLPKFF